MHVLQWYQVHESIEVHLAGLKVLKMTIQLNERSYECEEKDYKLEGIVCMYQYKSTLSA